MTSKINIFPLIKEHFNTFYLRGKNKNDNKRKDIKTVFLFFILPIGLSFGVICLFGNMNDSLSNSLLTCLSILSPLMFGFFPFIYELIDNPNVNPESRLIIKEFKANVLFTMLLSFTALAFILVWTLANNNLDFCYFHFGNDISNMVVTIIPLILSGIIYYFLFCLGFHILMIIQRFNFLINQYNEFKKNI